MLHYLLLFLKQARQYEHLKKTEVVKRRLMKHSAGFSLKLQRQVVYCYRRVLRTDKTWLALCRLQVVWFLLE